MKTKEYSQFLCQKIAKKKFTRNKNTAPNFNPDYFG